MSNKFCAHFDTIFSRDSRFAENIVSNGWDDFFTKIWLYHAYTEDLHLYLEDLACDRDMTVSQMIGPWDCLAEFKLKCIDAAATGYANEFLQNVRGN
jgi:hypothetical protein